MINPLHRSASTPDLGLPTAPKARTSADDTALEQSQLHQRLDALQQAPALNFAHEAIALQSLHWLHDRSLQQDTHTDSPYARQRRAQLGVIRGASTVMNQYGISIAKANPLEREHNLQPRVTHPVDSPYLRDNASEGYHERCQQLYTARYGNSRQPRLFVNTPQSAARILQHLRGPGHVRGNSIQEHLKHHLKPLQPGVYALELLSPRSQENADHLAMLYGATPSAYAVMANPSEHPQRPGAAGVDNLALLRQLFQPGPASVTAKLRAIPAEHGAGPLAATAADLVDSLAKELKDSGAAKGQGRHDPLLANGLQALHRIASALPSLSHDSSKFGSGYRILMEELQVCLSAAKPYDLNDFHDMALSSVAPDSLPDEVETPVVRLMTSGMGAISTAYEVARQLTGNPNVARAASAADGRSPAYYEVSEFEEFNHVIEGNADTFYATLNHSLPGGDTNADHQRNWNVDSVIRAARDHLTHRQKSAAPQVMILDATIAHRDDMDTLVSGLKDELASGKLRILVARSYQKFTNLCSSKVMAGSLALIGRDDELNRAAQDQLERLESEADCFRGNDAQLLTHFIRHQDHEFSLLERAVDNARFVAQQFFGQEPGSGPVDRRDDHLPFLSFDEDPGNQHRFKVQLGLSNYSPPIDRNDHVPQLLVHGRDSFAFSETTKTMIPLENDRYAVRIALGQESHAELAERFYMAGQLMHQPNVTWSAMQARDHLLGLVDKALAGQTLPADLTLGQKISLIARQQHTPPSAHARLNASPQTLRLEQQRLEQQGDSSLTMNKLASVMVHLAALVMQTTEPEDGNTGRDRDLLDALVKGMIQSGMPGVSTSARAAVMALRVHLSGADLEASDPNTRQRGFADIVDAARRLPGLPATTSLLTGIPHDTFTLAPEHVQDQAIEHLFKPLDNRSRLHVIDQLIQQGHFVIASACLEACEQRAERGTFTEGPTLAGNAPPEQSPHSLQRALVQQRMNFANTFRNLMDNEELSDLDDDQLSDADFSSDDDA